MRLTLTDSILEHKLKNNELPTPSFSITTNLKIRLIWIFIDKYGVNKTISNLYPLVLNHQKEHSTDKSDDSFINFCAVVHLVNHFYLKSRRVNNSLEFLKKYPNIQEKFLSIEKNQDKSTIN